MVLSTDLLSCVSTILFRRLLRRYRSYKTPTVNTTYWSLTEFFFSNITIACLLGLTCFLAKRQARVLQSRTQPLLSHRISQNHLRLRSRVRKFGRILKNTLYKTCTFNKNAERVTGNHRTNSDFDGTITLRRGLMEDVQRTRSTDIFLPLNFCLRDPCRITNHSIDTITPRTSKAIITASDKHGISETSKINLSIPKMKIKPSNLSLPNSKIVFNETNRVAHVQNNIDRDSNMVRRTRSGVVYSCEEPRKKRK